MTKLKLCLVSFLVKIHLNGYQKSALVPEVKISKTDYTSCCLTDGRGREVKDFQNGLYILPPKRRKRKGGNACD